MNIHTKINRRAGLTQKYCISERYMVTRFDMVVCNTRNRPSVKNGKISLGEALVRECIRGRGGERLKRLCFTLWPKTVMRYLQSNPTDWGLPERKHLLKCAGVPTNTELYDYILTGKF